MCDSFWPSTERCELLMHRLNTEMIKGLTTPDDATNDLLMINTYVTNLPQGTGNFDENLISFKETGSFLALDLGGTNYRLLLVTFEEPKKPPLIDEEVYEISAELQLGNANEVFCFNIFYFSYSDSLLRPSRNFCKAVIS